MTIVHGISWAFGTFLRSSGPPRGKQQRGRIARALPVITPRGSLDHGVDRRRSAGACDRYAMVAVAHGVATADAHHADRWQLDATMLGEPDPLPARAGGPRRAEAAVEQPRARRLDGADDRVDRDLAHRRGGDVAAARMPVAEDAEPTPADAAPKPRDQARTQPPTRSTRERGLCVESR